MIMKVICKTTWYWPDSYECVDLKHCITIGKIYDVLPNPCSKWVYNIIDDNGKEHDISKDCFELLRDINLDKLLE